MKTFNLAFIIGTAAAQTTTSAPTVAPTALVVPTVPGIKTALTVTMFSDAGCTQQNTANVYSLTSADMDKGSRTWKTNECVILSSSLSMTLDTLCGSGSSCVEGVSYDQSMFVGTTCSGTASSVTTVNYACTLVAGSGSSSGSAVQYKQVTRFEPTMDTQVVGLFNDGACRTSTTPIYITSGAGNGNCSDLYSFGAAGFESRITLAHITDQIVHVEVFQTHAPTNPDIDPKQMCARHLEVVDARLNRGQCEKLDAATATILVGLGGCATSDCYAYTYAEEDFFPSAASVTVASATTVVAVLSALVLLMQ